ncbi:uncharacterized protein LY89DRAFT_338429 [Mollisia scopiformis]|uniref:Uncharacterized protein n=1 Tax=Mollisia scopiformis TaxID=149040 RepID=A0A132B986_MOLSC|nr:uncharacterized protein LY89DRAFT_338429 [Mollisia scopiformis]KUJ08237.1 hypothetical protein LY89DRAFT_338429 [Mollisia scopiformis]
MTSQFPPHRYMKRSTKPLSPPSSPMSCVHRNHTTNHPPGRGVSELPAKQTHKPYLPDQHLTSDKELPPIHKFPSRISNEKTGFPPPIQRKAIFGAAPDSRVAICRCPCALTRNLIRTWRFSLWLPFHAWDFNVGTAALHTLPSSGVE